MHLIEHDIGGGVARRILPAGGLAARCRNPRLERVRGIVAGIEGSRPLGVTKFITVMLGAPAEMPDNFARAGIEQQLVRIEAVPGFRFIWSVRPQAVDQSRPDPRQETVKHAVMRPMQRIAPQLARATGIEHTEFDLLCVLREHREVDAIVARQRTHRFVTAFMKHCGQGIIRDHVLKWGPSDRRQTQRRKGRQRKH